MTSNSSRQHIARDRIRWIRKQLLDAHGGGGSTTYSTRGREREAFIDLFLSSCLPPQFRFGTGDVVDLSGTRTGQLDVVIELPFFPSLPLIGGTGRLYLAEAVGAIIEVKSNLDGQWDEAEATANGVAQLRLLGGSSAGLDTSRFPKHKPPVIVVGFKGWKQLETVQKKIQESDVAAVLQLEPPIYATGPSRRGGERCSWIGDDVLGILLVHLSAHLTSLSTKSSDIHRYFYDD